MSKSMETAAKIIGVFAIAIAMSLLRAFTLAKLWSWYVVPVFHVPLLTLWTTYGCLLIIYASSWEPAKPEPKDQREEWTTRLGRSLAFLAIVWGMAGILNLLK